MNETEIDKYVDGLPNREKILYYLFMESILATQMEMSAELLKKGFTDEEIFVGIGAALAICLSEHEAVRRKTSI